MMKFLPAMVTFKHPRGANEQMTNFGQLLASTLPPRSEHRRRKNCCLRSLFLICFANYRRCGNFAIGEIIRCRYRLLLRLD